MTDAATEYLNVNEEGEVYDRHATLAAARARQAQYPNDAVMRPATEAETAAYLAGQVTIPGALETDHGLLVPAEPTEPTAEGDLALARTDEATVRSLVGIGLGARYAGGVVLQQGRFLPGGRGLYAAVMVLVRRAGMPEQYAYSTHRVVVRSEIGQESSTYAEVGHYDLSRAEAERDLAER